MAYSPEEFKKIYSSLPWELRDILGSPETREDILNIADRYGVTDVEAQEKIYDFAMDVIIGLLSPTDFEKTLREQSKLDKEAARKITHEIHRFVFYPVRPHLEKLYRIEIEQPPASEKAVMGIAAQEKKAPEISVAQEKPEEPKRKDKYREAVEEE